MKIIGVLGGTSYISTPPYLIRLNELVAERLGAPHSAQILLWNIDYGPIKSLYGDPKGWERIPDLFAEEYRFLASKQPDCIILANNTLHKAYDIVADELPSGIPFFHTVQLTRDHCVLQGFKRVLFTGTAFTMEDDFFTAPLRAAGLDIVIPSSEHRAAIQAIQTQVSAGHIRPQHKEKFAAILDNYKDTEAVILACTELPLIAPQDTPQWRMINPAELQCKAAVDFASAS